jgi:hypothetical protein
MLIHAGVVCSDTGAETFWPGRAARLLCGREDSLWGHCVSVVKMRMLADVQSNLTAPLHADLEVAFGVDSFDSAQFRG